MSRRSRLTSVVLAGSMLALVGTQAVAAATPKAISHPMRSAPGVMVPYLRGVQDGTSTSVGPKRTMTLAAPTAVFQVNYLGTWPSAPKAAFQSAVDYWSNVVTSSVPIRINAKWSSLPGLTLGQAGPHTFFENFPGAPEGNVWYPVALANKIAGFDLQPGKADIDAEFDNNQPWYLGTDNTVPPNQLSFKATVMHELGHGLGFLGSFDFAGGKGYWGDSNGDPWIFDLFTERGSGKPMLSYTSGTATLGNALRSNDVWFLGTATDPAAKLYAPSSWSGGSSYSHLDEATYKKGTINSLMTPIGDYGEGNSTAGPLVKEIFDDIGWGPAPDLACTAPQDLTGDGFNDVLGISGTGDLFVAPGTGQGSLGAKVDVSTGFGDFKKAVIQDMDGDGCADMVFYSSSTHTIVSFPVTGSFDVGTATDIANFTGFGVTALAAVGDFNGDGNNDVIARDTSGRLWLVKGDGLGGSSGITQIGTSTSWKSATELFSAGDWDGDGKTDFFVRTKASNGTLTLERGNGTGGILGTKSLGINWNEYDEMFGSFDLSGDNLPDIVGRLSPSQSNAGSLQLERSTKTGGLQNYVPRISKGWGTFAVVD